MLFFYNLFLWIGFLFFLPGLIYKLKNRPGYKKTYAERFGRFGSERIEELKNWQNAIWIHAVSVGESMIALSLVKELHRRYPAQKVIISTTTTTGQELVRNKKDDMTNVIYAPIDFKYAVKKAFNVLRPEMLLILETELWPNMIYEAKKRNIKLGLLNARMSDNSCKGYYRLRKFFGNLLAQFDFISTQSELDGERFSKLSYRDNVRISGNLKFDQKVPENLREVNLSDFFGGNYGKIILGASTHDGEEELIISSYAELKVTHKDLKLILIPRHAERGEKIAELIENKGFSYLRKSLLKDEPPYQTSDILLADTTGEMLQFINVADIVIMGKSLAGHDEGHNLIEPALLQKAIVCGSVLKNFRYLLEILRNSDGVATVDSDEELFGLLHKLICDDSLRESLGKNAFNTIMQNSGATDKTIDLINSLR